QPFRAIGPEDLRGREQLTPVRDDVWMLGLSVPRAQPKYSICYVIATSYGGLHLINPGLDLPENHVALERALVTIGVLPAVRSIAASHLHADHVGIAGWLRARTGAPLLPPEREVHSLNSPSDVGIQVRLTSSSHSPMSGREWSLGVI